MDPKEVIRRVLVAMGEHALRRVRGQVGSSTLRSALRLIVEENQNRARLFIPHYWAIYYHDGRSGFSAPAGKKLVFFDDPRDDPRIVGRPERAAEVRRLTRSQYEYGLRVNAERRRLGRTPFMFVVDSVGPTRPHPFFDELGQNASAHEGPIAARVFDDWIQEGVDNDPLLRPEQRTVRFDFGL